MKRVLFSMVLVMAACVVFAQSKDAKEAKKIASATTPDFAKAEQLINADLQNPESKDDAANWDVAGFIQKRINEKEMEKAYLRQPYDTLRAYNSILNMYNYWMKADELAELPDEKGKVKNKYRKNNAATMMIERPNLINGGIQYFNENNNEEALKFFSMYLDAAKHPMFAKEDLLKNDTLIPQIAYYAALAAAKMENYPQVLKYAPLAVDNKEVGAYSMEFISTAYKAQNDTIQWIKSLQDGIQKYPDYPFFFGHLIDYYSNTNKFDEAMTFADNMLSRDPDNTFFLYVKGYLYHNMKDYDKAIEFYKKTIEADPSYAEAYSNIGLVYSQQAQDFADNATADLNDPKYEQDQKKIRDLNEMARPYYEKTRELKPDQTDLWLQGLYRIYYNLNMGPEFEEIEKLMGL
jgi:Putative Zn-dependent protease, contains TPR repeats